jgi:hypothetical protein
MHHDSDEKVGLPLFPALFVVVTVIVVIGAAFFGVYKAWDTGQMAWLVCAIPLAIAGMAMSV